MQELEVAVKENLVLTSEQLEGTPSAVGHTVDGRKWCTRLPVELGGSLSHYLQRFTNIPAGAGFLPSNSLRN